jgi:serine/threonine protein kinase
MELILDGGKTIRDIYQYTLIGKGGEAEIFDIGGMVLKLFKDPKHPDYSNSKDEQHGAVARIKEHQQKLLQFPKDLPKNVMAPLALARDKKGNIAGYVMPLVKGEVVYKLSERTYREQGVTDDTVLSIFRNLHTTLSLLHGKNVVVGDFNDLNVMFSGNDVSMIDTDSFQFGTFLSHAFTLRFVDPLNLDPHRSEISLQHPHNTKSDWYAYAAMLMQSLLYVGPYGGVYRPKDKSKKISHDLRPLKRITVFHEDIIYPKPARHYHILPDELLAYFHNVFEKDKRGNLPRKLIENVVWTKCSLCGLVHARRSCPHCTTAKLEVIKEVYSGKIEAKRIMRTSGIILHATTDGGTLRYLYHENNEYLREDKTVVIKGSLEPNMRYRISGEQTIFGTTGEIAIVSKKGIERLSVDSYARLPIFDANEEGIFFVENGTLKRIGELGIHYPETLGGVIPNQTMFWAGEKNGFGFYQAGRLTRHFVFRSNQKGINDSVVLPLTGGQLIDATAKISGDYIWFFISLRERGKTINRVSLLNTQGKLIATHEGTSGDGEFLSQIRGGCAYGSMLLMPTDRGIVRVESNGNALVVIKEWSETARFVDSSTTLLPGSSGLIAVGRNMIWNLKVT